MSQLLDKAAILLIFPTILQDKNLKFRKTTENNDVAAVCAMSFMWDAAPKHAWQQQKLFTAGNKLSFEVLIKQYWGWL